MTSSSTVGFRSLAAASLVAILAARPVPGACDGCRGFVAVDSEGVPSLVIARDAVAAAAGNLFGDAADEWIAAHPDGGIFVRSGDDGSLRIIPDLRARALAVGDGRLFAALAHGILEIDPVGGEGRFVAAVSATALAAADLDRDGADEIVAALDDGRLLLLDLDGDGAFPLGGLRAVALAGGDFLGRGYDQLALSLPAGGVRILDFLQDDAPLCFPGEVGLPSASDAADGAVDDAADRAADQAGGQAGAGAARSHGFSPLPSGLLVTLGAAGGFRVLDPGSCGIAGLDLSALEVTHEPVFSSARLVREAPAGGQVPGDCNQDGGMDISDAVCLLGHLFLGSPRILPCGDGSLIDAANTALLEANGDGSVDLSDAVYILSFLFLGGPPPILGRDCVPIEGCPAVCP